MAVQVFVGVEMRETYHGITFYRSPAQPRDATDMSATPYSLCNEGLMEQLNNCIYAK